MKAGVIIQARMGSTRLPGKTMKPFWGEHSILDVIISNLIAVTKMPIIVATTNLDMDSPIEELCRRLGVDCFRGDEHDVLKRFIATADEYCIDPIVRVCADNPFLDAYSIKELVQLKKTNDDYVAFSINGIPSIKTHYGFWGEVVSLSALKRVSQLTNDQIFHEHVTNYIYSHPESFNVRLLQIENKYLVSDSIRLTVDTDEDFRIAQEVFDAMNKRHVVITPDALSAYLMTRQDLLSKMSTQIGRNTK